MTELLDDDRLAAVLASLGEHLVVDVTDTTATSRLSRWRPLLAAAAVLAVVVATVVAVAPARRAVGGWFRAGRIEVTVERAAVPSDLPAFTDDVARIDPNEVDAVLGRPLPDVSRSRLGPPRGYWSPPEGGVLVGYADGSTTLWIVATDVSAELVKKATVGADVIVALDDLGDGGFALSGEHLVETPHRRLAADNVVAWSDGDLTFRLEGTGDVDDLTALAYQLDPT